MRSASPDAKPASAARRGHWLADAIIAGFVATGAATVTLVVAYLVAAAVGTPQGDPFRVWLWELTHNPVVDFSRGAPAVALGIHIFFGLVWAIVYARLLEPRLAGPGWQRGLLFSLLPWAASLLLFLPIAGAGPLGLSLGAGPMPVLGNLIVHLVYGLVLGQLYDASAERPAVAEDETYREPLEETTIAHSEGFAAAGIIAGIVLGAVVGGGLGLVLQPVGSSEGWSLAMAVGGALAGGAVGAIVGSFAGLPETTTDPSQAELGPDPFERTVLPFVLPLALVVLIAILIAGFGSILLRLAETYDKSLPVVAALVGTFAIALGGWWLTRAPQDSRSSRETVSHSDR